MVEKDDEAFKRIYSISHGVYGFNFEKSASSSKSIEVNPNSLNLNDVKDFLLFLEALNKGEQKSVKFLAKIPRKRIDQLKEKHKQLGAQLFVLN